jgi:hypothetical protein
MFIQSAFIRKNSPYLQEKLKEMGYKTDSTSVNTGCIATSSTHDSFVVIDESRFDSINPHVTWNNGNRIDCGNNEELFLAIAALRDDTNDYQWFIAQDTMWDENYNGEITVYFEEGEWLQWDYYSFMEDMPSYFRKATLEEIIKHFS